MGNHYHLKTAVDRNFLPAIVSYFLICTSKFTIFYRIRREIPLHRLGTVSVRSMCSKQKIL